MNSLDKEIVVLIEEIKKDIISTRNRVFENANSELISMYFGIGKHISENSRFLPPLVAKLPWTHNTILIDKVKDKEKRSWYAEKTFENGWSKTVLDHQIDLKLYERQADSSKKID